MPQTDHDRTIALAGLLLATHLVDELARRGHADDAAFATAVGSVFAIDAPSAAAVYGGLKPLKGGLELVVDQLTRRSMRLEPLRYASLILVLERRLKGRPDLLERIGDGIRTLGEGHRPGAAPHDATIACLADLYRQTVSTLTPRIMVQGDRHCLAREDVANRIRALLLAGMRGAFLWRQSGGGRLTLLLRRHTLVLTARQLLDDADHAPSTSVP